MVEVTGKVTVEECAILSADVYHNPSQLKHITKFKVWESHNQFTKIGRPHFQNPFFARLYLKKIASRPIAAVIAYRGTRPGNIANEQDDIDMALWHKQPNSEKLANAFYMRANHYVLSTFGLRLRLTGHSLGGALAQLTAIASEMHPETIVFNSPGVGEIKGIDPDASYPYIHNFNSRDGDINKVGKTLGSTTILNVSQGDFAINTPIDSPLNPTTPSSLLVSGLDLATKSYGIYKQHQIGDIILALKQQPQVGREAF